MKLFHFYSNVPGTNFSAEMRFLGGPDGNMRSGQRIKVTPTDSCQKYSSVLSAFYQSLMKSTIVSETQTPKWCRVETPLLSLDWVRPHLPQ